MSAPPPRFRPPPRLLSRFLLLLLALAGFPAPVQADESRATVTVYAAASLTEALQEIAAAYETTHAVDIRLSFASSGILARQIDAGAPAQLFAAADARWMDFLQQRQRIDAGSRRDLLGNTLVLIAPAGSPVMVRMQQDFDLAAAFTGKLCTGETASVPAGIYARQALESLGWWNALQRRVVGADDVRTALAQVERGECALGIVYRTDAAISRKVTVLGEFPANSHDMIVYPFALLPAATPDARAFFSWLQGAAARRVFERRGFRVNGNAP